MSIASRDESADFNMRFTQISWLTVLLSTISTDIFLKAYAIPQPEQKPSLGSDVADEGQRSNISYEAAGNMTRNKERDGSSERSLPKGSSDPVPIHHFVHKWFHDWSNFTHAKYLESGNGRPLADWFFSDQLGRNNVSCSIQNFGCKNKPSPEEVAEHHADEKDTLTQINWFRKIVISELLDQHYKWTAVIIKVLDEAEPNLVNICPNLVSTFTHPPTKENKLCKIVVGIIIAAVIIVASIALARDFSPQLIGIFEELSGLAAMQQLGTILETAAVTTPALQFTSLTTGTGLVMQGFGPLGEALPALPAWAISAKRSPDSRHKIWIPGGAVLGPEKKDALRSFGLKANVGSGFLYVKSSEGSPKPEKAFDKMMQTLNAYGLAKGRHRVQKKGLPNFSYNVHTELPMFQNVVKEDFCGGHHVVDNSQNNRKACGETIKRLMGDLKRQIIDNTESIGTMTFLKNPKNWKMGNAATFADFLETYFPSFPYMINEKSLPRVVKFMKQNFKNQAIAQLIQGLERPKLLHENACKETSNHAYLNAGKPRNPLAYTDGMLSKGHRGMAIAT